VVHRESLAYLYGLQRFGIKLGLENIRKLLARAGNPQHSMSLVHVAGTNGKGSVCNMLAALIQKAGHRTGLYTSPHLHDFSERIRVDGAPISSQQIVSLTDQLKQLCGQDIPATFFEFTTAMALCHFRDERVAWGVLETGMGGRLDATNTVQPRVTVITSIAQDHAEHLGGDLATIAAEKAGIIKPQVPVISAAQPPEVEEVLARQAAIQQAPLYRCGHDFHIVRSAAGLRYQGMTVSCDGLALPLAGDHQYENLALALAACELAGLLDQADCVGAQEALAGVAWPGRLEWWRGERRILLDGAHNLAGCQTLAGYLQQQQLSRVILLFGAKADKQAVKMLAELMPYAKEVLLAEPPVDAAADLAPLVKLANASGVPVSCCVDLNETLRERVVGIGDEDVLVVAGSLFLVAAVRELLMEMR